MQLAERPAIHFGRYFINVEGLKEWGYDLEKIGITCHKSRPYVVVTSNRKMTWLIPLSSQLKGSMGRVVVQQRTPSGVVHQGEAVTTDLFILPTYLLEKFGKVSGKVTNGEALVSQLSFAVECGRLGKNR